MNHNRSFPQNINAYVECYVQETTFSNSEKHSKFKSAIEMDITSKALSLIHLRF